MIETNFSVGWLWERVCLFKIDILIRLNLHLLSLLDFGDSDRDSEKNQID